MAYDPCPNLYEAALETCQRPVGYLYREVDTLQEDTKVISQCVKLKPDLIITEPLAGQAGPGDGVLAFFDHCLAGYCAAMSREGAALRWRADCKTGTLL